jgi:hypothetical protein
MIGNTGEQDAKENIWTYQRKRTKKIHKLELHNLQMFVK